LAWQLKFIPDSSPCFTWTISDKTAVDLDIDTKKPVLIVDDDVIILNLLLVILKKIGFRDIREAPDGQKALVKILSTIPGLVITDIDMPVMNGLQLVRQIRRKKVFDRVPIIALTVNDTKQMVIKALKTGVDSYLIKGGIKEADVRAKIQEAMAYRIKKLAR
jgi:two-component system chemotaxis response regulator CheY